MDEPTGDGSVGDVAKFATLRGLGYASDLGRNLADIAPGGGALVDSFFRDNQSPAAKPPAQAQKVERRFDPIAPNDARTDRRLAGVTPGSNDNAPGQGSTDYTGALNSRPGGRLPELPNSLRDNVVYKTVDPKTGRTTYSGRNVGVNADGETAMMNGDGTGQRMINGNNGSGSMSLRNLDAKGQPTGPNYGLSNSGGGASTSGDERVSAALTAASLRGDQDAVRQYYFDRGETFGGQTADQFRDAEEERNAPRRGQPGFKAYQENRLEKAKLRQLTDFQNESLAATRENNKALREQAAATMYQAGAPARMQAARLQAMQKVMQMHTSKGGEVDFAAAADTAEKYGLSEEAAKIRSGVAAKQTDGDARAKSVRDSFKGKFVMPDGKGGETNDTWAEGRAVELLQALEGENLTPDKMAQRTNEIINRVRIVQGMRDVQQRRNLRADGWQGGFGRETNSLPTDIPDGVHTRKPVGFWDGKFSGADVGSGDHDIGGDYQLRGQTDQSALKWLDEVYAQRQKDGQKKKD